MINNDHGKEATTAKRESTVWVCERSCRTQKHVSRIAVLAQIPRALVVVVHFHRRHNVGVVVVFVVILGLTIVDGHIPADIVAFP
jgi:hypothetical protein